MPNLKNKIALFLAVITLAISAQSKTIGFSAGNDFKAVGLHGEINVQCYGSNPTGPSWGHAYCDDVTLEPAEYSYFVGPENVEADSVTLQATRQDGSVSKSKTENYDYKTGKSTDSFNLWINTLLQKPLLKHGKNIVNFTMSKSGQAVHKGQFEATISDGGDRTCHYRGMYSSSDSNDCTFAERYCWRYFQDNNYCQ